jgi:diguanylate cyclase (GGDEF)-like protein
MQNHALGAAASPLLQGADRLQTLNEIGRVLSSTLDLATLYRTIYEQVSRVMDTSICFIALHDVARNMIEWPFAVESGKVIEDAPTTFGGSVTSWVIERGEPVRFDALDEYIEFGRENGLGDLSFGEEDPESMIFVPLNTGSRAIGALSVQSQRRNAYDDGDVQLLMVLASQAAVAIANADLYATSQSNLRNMQALLDVAQLINGSLDLPTVLDSILKGMRSVLPYYFAAILLPQHSKGHLTVAATIGPLSEEDLAQITIPFGHGITGRVFETGIPLNVGDITTFEGYVEHGILEIRSEMTVPLKRGDAVIGVLDVEREYVNAFSEEELDVLMLFASQAAIAIENARLFSEQRRRVDELQTIQSIVQKLTPLHDINAVCRLVGTEFLRLTEYNICGIFRAEAESGDLIPVYFGGGDFPHLRVRPGEGLTGWVAQHGTSELVTNSLSDTRVAPLPGRPTRPESLISTPLIYQGRVQGVITLTKLGVNQFDENALRLLEIIAAQTAIAFDRARLYDELRTEAITDPLTKLYNRRYLLERFKEEKSRALRNHHTLAAIMLDIDTFKRVNDRYGHDAGDVVLQEIALVIRAAVRAEDIVARYGGEEFCILLPEIPVEEAEHVAERLRAMIERRVLPESAGVRSVTVSVGMALLREEDPASELFTRADHAMYAVKHAGGNRVCVPEGNAFRLYTERGRDEEADRTGVAG